MSRGVIISRKEDGSPLRFLGTHQDIDQRKQDEEALKTSRETFANSFNYSGIGKALLGPGGKWLEVNDVICGLTGYTRKELLELHYRDITYPDDMDIDMPYIQQLLRKEIPSYTIEKRYVSKTRQVIVVSLTVTLIWENQTTPKYFICDIVDITRTKELIEEITRQKFQLEAASEDLMMKMNQVEELNNIVAHNLRGPVGNIKLLSEETALFSEKDALGMIHESAISLQSELDMLMDITRIKLNKKISLDVCDVTEMVDSVTKQLQGIIYQENICIQQYIHVPYVNYPKTYLESILYNLISNAIKYRRADSTATISIATSYNDGKLQLSVKDNGLGIDMEKYKDRIFKLNQVFHSGYDSKGVGLFITKTQIESLGGTIEVVSKLNEGSEFIVTF